MKPQFKFWPPILLAGITAICYLNSLHGQFVFDDQVIVFQPEVMNVRSLGDVASISVAWRRFLFFTYALNYYWSGLNTFSYHLVNLILHVVNVLLVYWIIVAVLRRLRSGPLPEAAFAGALIFGVHTLFSGAVSYISGRSSLLCATFYFFAISLFLKGLDTPRSQKRTLYFILMGLSGLIAWQVKQEAITLPLLLASFLFLESKKKNWAWIGALAVIPLVVAFLIREQLAALYGMISANKVLVSAGFGEVLAMPVYLRTYLAAVVGYYLPRFAYPVGLSVDPDIVPVQHWYSPEFLFALLALTGLAWLTFRFQERQPLFSLGVTALLVSPLVAYAVIPLPDLVQEHRAYIPGLGIAFLAAWLFQWLTKNHLQWRWIVWAVLTAMFVVMTVSRNRVWADNLGLWEDAAAKAPGKPRAHFNLGQAYQNAGRWPEATREYARALELKPDIYAAYSNMAAMLLDQGQFDKARELLLKVTTLSPGFTEGFINLGVLYLRQRETDEAIQALSKAVELDPGNFGAHFNKAEALSQKGDFKAALEEYKKTVHLRPDLPSFRMALGTAYSKVGDQTAAEKEFLGLTNGPLAADAHHNLGVIHLQKQMLNEAIEQFRTTLAQQPSHGPAVLNLALAYQVKGDLPSARHTLETYIQQYGNSNSPYIAQARVRLESLK